MNFFDKLSTKKIFVKVKFPFINFSCCFSSGETRHVKA